MMQYGDIGGGQYGFNASDSENADDPMDVWYAVDLAAPTFSTTPSL